MPEKKKTTVVIYTYPHLIPKIDALVKILEQWLKEAKEKDKESQPEN